MTVRKNPSKSKENKANHTNVSVTAKNGRMSFLPPIENFPKDLTVENVSNLLLEGYTGMEIWKHCGVAASTYYRFLQENSALLADVRKTKADTYADLSELILKESKGSMNELIRAKEQAQIFKWRARQANPELFGDKVTLSGDVDHPLQITGMRIVNEEKQE